MIDSGTTSWTLPAAVVKNVQTVSLRNVNGSTGVTETSTITAVALSAGQTVSAAGQTLLATTNLTASAVAAALAGTATSGTGFTLAGTLADFTKAAGGVGTNTVVYTSTTANAPVADLVVAGTAQSGVPQVTVLTITIGAAASAITYSFNGVTVSAPIVTLANSSITAQAAALAASINAYAGSSIATANAAQVIIDSKTPVSLAGFTASNLVLTNVLALATQKQVLSGTITGTTSSFIFNGVSVETPTHLATIPASVAALVSSINAQAGATIASVSSSNTAAAATTNDTLVIDYGAQGANITTFATTGGTYTAGTTTTSTGIIAASPVTQSTVQGVALSATDTINAANFIGSTSFVSDSSTGAVIINNLSTQSVTAKTNAAALTANYLATAASSTLNITDGTSAGAVAITGTGLTSATVNSTGGAQSSSGGTVNTITSLGLPATVTALTINAATSLTTGTITSTALKTVTVGGLATTVSVSTIPVSVTSFNASGLTAGGVSATLSATANSTFTGGAGVDTITTADTTATGQIVDAGGGTADVLVLTSTNDVSTIPKAAQYLNFEVLRLAKATQGDLSIFGNGITALQLGTLTSGNFSGITATQAGNITVRDNQTTALTLTLANATGASDVVSLDLKNSSSTASNVDIAGLSIIGVETLNLKGSTQSLTSGQTSDVSFGSGGATNLTAINVTGSANTTIVATNTALTLTLDASASTGTFGATGDFIVGSTIKGSATKVNTFVVGGTSNNGSTYIGGSANDSFGTSAALLVANGTGDTTLTGGTGIDTLSISGAGDLTMTDNNFTYVTGFELLTLASTSVVSLTTGAAFNTAFATGVVITNATQAAAKAYTLAAGLSNSAITFSLTTGVVGTGASEATTVTTGSGNDVLTISATAFTGGSSGSGITVQTGAGSDTITISTHSTTALATSAATKTSINGGAGQDFITATKVNGNTAGMVFSYTMDAGQSTTTASDNITGFKLGVGSGAFADILDFTSAQVTAYATTGSTGVAGLSVAVATSTGLVTFSGTNAATASLADRINAVQTVVSANQGDSALFTFIGNSYVFNNDTAGDSLVTLIGVTGTALGASAATTGLIGIA